MRVDALCFIMFVIVRAPLGFEIEDVEIKVCMLWQQVMDQSHLDVLHRMRKRTIVPVLALPNFVWVAMAKFCLILVLVVEPLDSVVRSSALIPLGTPLSVSKLA